MEHLRLEIFDLDENGVKSTNSQFAYLPDDASITITDTSEIFASGDVWSYSFTLNTAANAHIFGTAGELHGSRLHEQINKRRARLWVEGIPMYLGYLKLDDEVEVDKGGNVDVSFESGQKTFDSLIDGGKANQVPLMGDVPIGMALWRKRWTEAEVSLYAASATTGTESWVGEQIYQRKRPHQGRVRRRGRGQLRAGVPAHGIPEGTFPQHHRRGGLGGELPEHRLCLRRRTSLL